jgi:hypothetical protein
MLPQDAPLIFQVAVLFRALFNLSFFLLDQLQSLLCFLDIAFEFSQFSFKVVLLLTSRLFLLLIVRFLDSLGCSFGDLLFLGRTVGGTEFFIVFLTHLLILFLQ